MDAQRLSCLLDTLIEQLLAQRKPRLQTHRQVMRVVLSGEDHSTLPTTLDCLAALDRSGYSLVMTFSHSARRSSLQSSCLDALARRGITVLCDNQEPRQTGASFNGLYLPVLSTNSMSKIALGIRDNLVCRWAFHALNLNKPVIVTLNAECRHHPTRSLPPAFQARLAHYAATLVAFGFTVIGQQIANADPTRSMSANKPLITLGDVRRYQRGQALHIGNRTLITPAAHDEIRARGIIIVQSHQEETCIWQK